MANQTGRPIAPARRLVAAIIATLAIFVIVFGLGMGSPPVAVFGVAVLAVAVVVAFMKVSRRGRATVAGSAEVKSITPAPLAGAYGRATLELIVVAPGLGAFDTIVRESRVPVEKWPLPGTTVPITVDVDDTRRVRVNWRDAPARAEGEDPPPPPQPQPTSRPDDELDDELFGAVDPAPWEGRRDDWDVDSGDPPPHRRPRPARAPPPPPTPAAPPHRSWSATPPPAPSSKARWSAPTRSRHRFPAGPATPPASVPAPPPPPRRTSTTRHPRPGPIRT